MTTTKTTGGTRAMASTATDFHLGPVALPAVADVLARIERLTTYEQEELMRRLAIAPPAPDAEPDYAAVTKALQEAEDQLDDVSSELSSVRHALDDIRDEFEDRQEKRRGRGAGAERVAHA